MATQQDIHIGQRIKAVFDESGMSVSEFARQIHLERSTVYGIFQRPSIDSMLLARISLVLKHNFLSDIEQHYGLIPKTPSFTIHLDNVSPETVLQLAKLLNATLAI
jgi:plasmid maintenance system antidote protein VapI